MTTDPFPADSRAPADRPAVDGPTADEPGRLSRSGRAAAGVWLAVLVGGFGLARALTPSPAGLGTHQQLGLPQCTVRTLFGVPCPSCGMTTSFAHFTRGQWADSWRANAGGFLLAVLCAAQLPWVAWAAATGRPWGLGGEGRAARPEWWAVAGLSLVGAVTLVDWAVRLAG